jgi:hypothetical protein
LGLCSCLRVAARDKVGAEKDHTLAYTYWEKRPPRAANDA